METTGEQHPCHVGHGQEYEPPAGHEHQSGLWAEHSIEKDGSHDGNEAESSTSSRDRRRSDAVTGTTDPQLSAGRCHRDRDECQSQDLDRVRNGVPDESQKTHPGRQDEHRCGAGEQIASEVALPHRSLGPSGDLLGACAACLAGPGRSASLHMRGSARNGCMMHRVRARPGCRGLLGLHGGGLLTVRCRRHLASGCSGGLRRRGCLGVSGFVIQGNFVDGGLSSRFVEALPGGLGDRARFRGACGRCRLRLVRRVSG